MPRYNRVNLDGKSVTETRKMAAALYPGTIVTINGAGNFAQATAQAARLYVLNPAYHQGLNIDEQIPAGDSGVGEYLEEGRELAVRVPAGTYTKDQQLTMSATGQVIPIPATAGTYQVIGNSQDAVVLAAVDFIRIRVASRATSVTVS